MYETTCGEKLFCQFPGIESVREGVRCFPFDSRQVLQKSDGTYANDMDFKAIWDVIDRLGQGHKDDIDILATVFLRIAYMIDYQHNECDYCCDTVDIPTGNITSTTTLPLAWNSLAFDADIIDTLNDRFPIDGFSMEGFLYYNDLLAQNEDCKYSYLRGDSWDIKTGRINNCLSHLTIISHIRGYIGISKLVDSFQRTGVAPLPQGRLHEACGDLVTLTR